MEYKISFNPKILLRRNVDVISYFELKKNHATQNILI